MLDPLLLSETREAIAAAMNTDPALTHNQAVEEAVHGGPVHDLHGPGPCYSRLCRTVTGDPQ